MRDFIYQYDFVSACLQIILNLEHFALHDIVGSKMTSDVPAHLVEI